MANLNRVLLIGNLTRDPELRYTPSGTAVADFGLAMNRYYTSSDGAKQEETCFVDIVVWGRQAENCHKYLDKGRRVFVEGRLKLDTWEKDGQKRSKHQVVADNVQFLDYKSRDGDQDGGGYSRSESRGGGGGGYNSPDDDEQIPF